MGGSAVPCDGHDPPDLFRARHHAAEHLTRHPARDDFHARADHHVEPQRLLHRGQERLVGSGQQDGEAAFRLSPAHDLRHRLAQGWAEGGLPSVPHQRGELRLVHAAQGRPRRRHPAAHHEVIADQADPAPEQDRQVTRDHQSLAAAPFPRSPIHDSRACHTSLVTRVPLKSKIAAACVAGTWPDMAMAGGPGVLQPAMSHTSRRRAHAQHHRRPRL